jgi:hypothetical protein
VPIKVKRGSASRMTTAPTAFPLVGAGSGWSRLSESNRRPIHYE